MSDDSPNDPNPALASAIARALRLPDARVCGASDWNHGDVWLGDWGKWLDYGDCWPAVRDDADPSKPAG